MIALLLASIAAAAPPDPGWALGVAAAAEVPLSTGAQLTLEAPGRFRLGGGVGLVPDACVEGLGGLAGLAAGADLAVRSEGSRVYGASLGWRPFRASGLWLGGELRALSLQASTVLGEVAAAPEGAVPVTLALGVDLALAGGTLGWDWVLGHAIVVRFWSSLLWLLDGQVALDAAGSSPAATGVTAIGQTLEGRLDRGLVVPTVGLAVGLRLGQRPHDAGVEASTEGGDQIPLPSSR